MPLTLYFDRNAEFSIHGDDVGIAYLLDGAGRCHNPVVAIAEGLDQVLGGVNWLDQISGYMLPDCAHARTPSSAPAARLMTTSGLPQRAGSRT